MQYGSTECHAQVFEVIAITMVRERFNILADELEYSMQVNCSLKMSLHFPQSKCPCEWKFLAAEIATAYSRSESSTKNRTLRKPITLLKGKDISLQISGLVLNNIFLIKCNEKSKEVG